MIMAAPSEASSITGLEDAKSKYEALLSSILSRKEKFSKYSEKEMLCRMLYKDSCPVTISKFIEIIGNALKDMKCDFTKCMLLDLLVCLLAHPYEAVRLANIDKMMEQFIQNISCVYDHPASDYSFVILWKRLNKNVLNFLQSVNKSTVATYFESIYALTELYLKRIQSVSVVIFHKLLDLIRKFIAFQLYDNYDAVENLQRRMKDLVMKCLPWETLVELMNKFELVPGGFLGVAQHTTASDQSDAAKKTQRKLALLILQCGVHKGSVDLECFLLVEKFLQQDLGDDVWVLNVFTDTDNVMNDVMLTLLDSYLILYRASPDDVSGQFPPSFQPHAVFVGFLQHIDWDSSLLVDFCISPETCFLVYFTKYLKLLLSTWEEFKQACDALQTRVDLSYCSPMSPRNQDSSEITDVSSCAIIAENSLACNKTPATRTGQSLVLVDYPSSDDDDAVNGSEDVVASDDVMTKDSQTDIKCVSGESVLDRCMAVLYRTSLSLERFNQQKLITFNVLPLIKLLNSCECLYEKVS